MDKQRRAEEMISGSVQDQLDVLSNLLKEVFLPLETKNIQTRKTLEKFISHISHTSVQVSGTVSIQLPIVPPGTTIQIDIKDSDLMNNYLSAMESWNQTIKDTLKRESERTRLSKTALAEIELWRSRSASYQNLTQQLSHNSVGIIKERLEAYSQTENGLGNGVVDQFLKNMKNLNKNTAEAKENVKFLTTLERQFKNLASEEGFKAIQDTIPSLMNGLKMVWIISRNYKNIDKMQELISLITDEIADKVQNSIQISKLFDLDEKAESQLQNAKELIMQGKKILQLWESEFQRTQVSMDQEQLQRWEFQPKPLVDRCKHMVNILRDLLTITENMKKFLVFLGPNLKSVTGNSEGIDKLTVQVKQLVVPFVEARENFFDKANSTVWNQLYNNFKAQQITLEHKTMKLIDSTFSDLRSSQGAFDLLNNFKNIQTLDEISKRLQKKYTDVLNSYRKQLDVYKNLFINGKKAYEQGNQTLVISRGKPPIAGIISWAKSLIQRMKTPIVKFHRNEDKFDKQQYQEVKSEYLTLVKEIDHYQQQKYAQWSSNIMDRAMQFLKEKILIKKDENTYVVNFKEDFKVLIQEAKQLEKMNHNISKAIVNIALQEKEYYRYIDKLKTMLRQYNEAVHSLNPIEKSLLENQIQQLNKVIEQGHESKNLSSLGINDFIENCRNAIRSFRDIKKKVAKSSGMIEDIVKSIEDAIILKQFNFEERRDSPFNPTEFSAYSDEHMQKTIQELSEKYKIIGDQFLKNIEQFVLGTSTKCSSVMKEYYYYWERRIYNALFKMTLRALVSFKALVKQPIIPGSDKFYPLFQVKAQYQHPYFTTNPAYSDLFTILTNIPNNIISMTKNFWRWMDGSCEFCKPGKGPNDEVAQKFDFHSDIMNNSIIKKVKFLLNLIYKKANDRVRKYEEMFEPDPENKDANKKNPMWDPKLKLAVEKLKDKNPPTSLKYLETKMGSYKDERDNYKNMPKEKIAFFFSVSFESVIHTFKLQAESWVERYGNVLREIGNKDLELINRAITDYEQKLEESPSNIEELKSLLNKISEIKTVSMMMEFRISDVVEKYRTLQMYKQPVEEDVVREAFSLEKKWKNLTIKAFKKDANLEGSKQMFAKETQEDVAKFKEGLVLLHQQYKSEGPSSSQTTLDDGLRLIEYYKQRTLELNKRKQELVLAEKLFDLPISTFPELVSIDEENKFLQPLYDLYRDVKGIIKDYSSTLWMKLDAEQLQKAIDKLYNHMRRKLAQKYSNEHPVYRQLNQSILAFKNSIPLIILLKNGSITDRHWEKLMKLTGKKFEASIKTMTLKEVFDMKLEKFQEQVEEIVNEAIQEFKNEEELNKIDQVWKKENFDLVKYKKGNDDRGWVLTNIDEKKLLLEDQLSNLQTVASSKYAGAFATRIRNWQRALNLISECIEVWMLVQKKWIYLEGIFIGNEDIKQQLKEQSKKFEKNNVAFKKIMQHTYKTPNIYACCVLYESKLSELKNLSEELDRRQKSLTEYLDSKRFVFSRFYFLSDDDLLSILGSSDPEAVQPHMLKLFDNCKELKMSKSKQVTGMESDEGERFSFREIVKPEDSPVQIWMTKVDLEMKKTLHRITKESVFKYGSQERVSWVVENLGMVAIVGTQIWWTWRVEDVFDKVREGNKYAMKEESAKQTKDLNDLIDLVRTDLNSQQRKKINSLIIIDVHARDIVDRFVRDSILDKRQFEWESQLRFYWSNSLNDIRICQCTGSFAYGYEYEGLNGRLVITPLTDRCVMTLTTALTFRLGGAPAGPAGTGKTETVKDLAKSLAIRCCVTNCGQGLDYEIMGSIFSGLVMTGFWGCFDEFNRITPEVLSVVSVQLKTIQTALSNEKKTLELLKKELNINPTVGIFVTMNPGYAGRTELPDNLKALFRPVTMVVPDSNIICEIMLMSQGFNEARLLAKKMTVLYKLASEQLSKQYHYDFGLRALKSVLVMAGQLKREDQTIPEEDTLMRALRDMNMPKFVFDDVPLFKGLIGDLFPGMDPVRKPYEKKDKIVEVCESLGLQPLPDDNQIDKVVQLFETMGTRHTTMVVGPTGSGKSAVIEILKKVENSTIYCINPKSITVPELYGEMNQQTRQWTDGLLSKIFRIANEKSPGGKEQPRWILYDGDVDAIWVESMNSVMDDNKLLTLINGDRIRLERFCKMLFEVSDLQYASPATISRCGMVYVDPRNLGYEPYWHKWMLKFTKHKQKYAQFITNMNDIYPRYIPELMARIFDGVDGDETFKPLEFALPRTNLNVIVQLTKILDSLINIENLPDADQLENVFVFAVVWSLGICLSDQAKKVFEEKLRQKMQRPGPDKNKNIFDYFIDHRREWKHWKDTEEIKKFKEPEGGKFSKILVPTVDTLKFSFILNHMITNKYPCLFVGESGTAKSVIISNYLSSLSPDHFMKLNINFSSRTTSRDLQTNIEDNIDKRSGRIFGPKILGKQLIIFIDDLHMPKVDTYGTQQPIALLRFFIEKNYIYERSGNLDMKIIKDTQVVSALLPPSVATMVDPRLLSLFATYNLVFPSDDNVKKIYNEILGFYLVKFNSEIQSLKENITDATLKLYKQIVELLPRTPVKFHYIFNLRDLSRVYEGLSRATIDKFENKDQFVRLWRNECMRVFCDRLLSEEDRDVVNNKVINSLVKAFFEEQAEYALQDPIIFGDFMTSNPADENHIDPKLYEDCGDFKKVRDKFDFLLQEYNYDESNMEMNLVLFDDALYHLTKIYRIIRFPLGHALLVGYGGSGKQSLTKLSAFTAKYRMFTITLTRGYKEKEFREDLKLLFSYLCEGPVLFLFTDAHVIEEGFLELVNNLLTIGMVPALFDEDEKKSMYDKLRNQAKQLGIQDTKEDMWNFFIEKTRNNLHIVLAMSPAGSTLRIRCRNFPGLISNTSIDWFFAWPEEALISVCDFYLKDIDLPESNRQSIVSHIVYVHLSVQDYSREFEEKLKRVNYATPKNYLDFLKKYIKSLESNNKQFNNLIQRYKNGLLKLKEAKDAVSILRQDLEVKQKEVNGEKIQVEAILEEIKIASAETQKNQSAAADKKRQLDIESDQIERQKSKAEAILKDAEPQVAEAQKALNVVDSKQLTTFKALNKPPKQVEALGITIMYLRPTGTEDEKDGWEGVRRMIANPSSFIGTLKEFGKRIHKVTRRQIDIVIERIANKEFEFDRMEEISRSAYNLLLWLNAMVKLYKVYKEVEPLKKKVEEMQKKAKQMAIDLEQINNLVETLTKQLHEANENRIKKQARLDELTQQATTMERKLNAAEKLLSGLGREEIRWGKDEETLTEKIINLTGDCLTTSAFLSYSGPFNFDFRQRMIYEDWRQDIAKRNIPLSDKFKVQSLLTNDVEIAKWASEELPSDELSVQNGILSTKATRWPLCIDPQLQAVNWIKKRYEGPNMKSLNLNDGPSAFMKDLQNTIKRGGCCLFENIDEELDPTLDPLLEKNIVGRGGDKSIKLTDTYISYNDNFRLYFTTKLSNPKYSPEIMGKTMVINFTVTMMGLRDQLLNVVVSYEKPEKEKQRKELIHQMSENRKKLKEAEDQLLNSLSQASGSLLDNEPLIGTLESTKKVSLEISEDIAKGEITAQEIEEARQSYSPAAQRGAILFFAMVGLSKISQMYEYSLGSYLIVFNNSLRDAKNDPVLETRLRAIIDKLTLNVYEYTCLGIFEVHKLMFSFHMTVMIIEEQLELNRTELDFFLKGNQSLSEIEQSKLYKWIPELGWKDLQKLVSIGPDYRNIIDDLKNNEKEWKKWYDFEAPEKEDLPEGYGKLTPFQILLILRVFRSDRVVNGMKRFIIDFHKTDKFVQPPTVNYDKIFKASNEKSPIVFILSPGADPLSDVQNLANDEGFSGNKFKYLSLGQGMEKEANIYLSTSANRGHWLMLQNCHLLTGWLKDHLEKFLQTLSKPHKDFRLWLTTQPTDAFPLGILQKALKVVTEPPDGLRLNMRSTLSKLSEESLNECPHEAFKPLVYVVSFFHAIIQDRRKYGKIGWNVAYDFNQSDFAISYRLLNMYLKKAYDNQEEAIPWNSLKYLIGEAMYGGRVTDDWDRRTMMTYLEEYMGDFLFDKNRDFFFAETPEFNYQQPKIKTLEGFLNSVNQIPIINSPMVFGLHPNAQITYFTNLAKKNWEDLLLMQVASSSSGASGASREDNIESTANDVLSKLPETLWDIGIIRAESADIGPTRIVLFQQLERFNKLIDRIKQTLINLKRALKGQIGMSSELDQLALSLDNGNLPAKWAKLAPQTEKKLGSWMTHFSNRIKQYNNWVKIEQPPVMWLSGLHIPESYLTALVQTSCRLKGWALDKSLLYTVVMKTRNTDNFKKKPQHGCYIQGLYLEGASWDLQGGCLVRQQPKQLVTEMPIIQIIPAEANKLKLKDNLKTPVYMTQNRKNAMGFGQVFTADLKTEEHVSHWILQGVALVLNVDY